MVVLIDMVVLLFFLTGMFFFMIGVLGLLRLQDVYLRMHATAKCDTLGATAILLGLAIYSLASGQASYGPFGSVFTAAKMIIIIIFIFWANPTAAHAIAKAAYLSGVKLWEGSVFDQYGPDVKDRMVVEKK
ncbi:MAG: monovalent cation/H(+) antiporter subunit G [Candidatus Hydrothermarchaeales archaeon]